MTDFCAISDVERLLQMQITEADKLVSLDWIIGKVTAAIKAYCNQEIELVEDDEHIFDVDAGQRRLFLPELPVVSVSEVVEDGDALTAGSGGDYQVTADGSLYRLGRNWQAGIQIVSVTYTHGYATIPDTIEAVCARASARVYQAGLRAAEMDGIPGVASKSLGDFSVSYVSGQGGGVGQGVLGVSGSRALLLSEKDALDKYRYKRL